MRSAAVVLLMLVVAMLGFSTIHSFDRDELPLPLPTKAGYGVVGGKERCCNDCYCEFSGVGHGCTCMDILDDCTAMCEECLCGISWCTCQDNNGETCPDRCDNDDEATKKY